MGEIEFKSYWWHILDVMVLFFLWNSNLTLHIKEMCCSGNSKKTKTKKKTLEPDLHRDIQETNRLLIYWTAEHESWCLMVPTKLLIETVKFIHRGLLWFVLICSLTAGSCCRPPVFFFLHKQYPLICHAFCFTLICFEEHLFQHLNPDDTTLIPTCTGGDDVNNQLFCREQPF